MLLLAVIYLSFISLGLPDSLLGAAWPTMRVEMGAPLALAGAVSMICSAGTIVSSLMSTRLINRFGTGRVTLVSVAMTAVALTGYALAPAPWLLYLAAIPLGLGGGSVDAALNNYVSLHYKAKHMSWLHCFWGVGATLGPMILSACIGLGSGWRTGYWTVIGVQCALVAVLAFTQSLWKKQESPAAALESDAPQFLTNTQALRLPGMKAVLVTFFCYCSAEASMMLWTASFAQVRGATVEQAAFASSMFFVGITAGRALNGFLAIRFDSKTLIRAGIGLMLLGIVILMLPLGYAGCLIGATIVGLGCAPVYPCTIHETPHRFGAAASQAATGLQMATAYTGSTLMPPLLGAISGAVGLQIMPYWMLLLTLVMFLCSENVNRRVARKAQARA